LNKLDKTTNQLCPFLAAGVVISTLYWSAASYGAITVMQVCYSSEYIYLFTVLIDLKCLLFKVMGEQEAITMMEDTDPYMLLLMLPSIPLSLILGKTINWEETLLLLVQRFTSQLPLLRTIMPSFL